MYLEDFARYSFIKLDMQRFFEARIKSRIAQRVAGPS